MGGLDDFVEDVDEQKEVEEAKGILDELDIDSKEELEELDDRLDRIQQGLLHYDKRMEELEGEVRMLREVVSKLLTSVNNNDTTDSATGQEQGSKLFEQKEGSSDDTDAFDW